MRPMSHLPFAASFVLLFSLGVARAQSWISVDDQLLVGSDTNADDRFGGALALSGDTLLVGAPQADPNERGAVYVFVRSNGTWSEQAKLIAPPTTVLDFDHFGAAVALEGDLAVIGAPDAGANDGGAAFVFRRSGTSWALEAPLVWTSPFAQERFGTSVAIADATVAVGAPRRNGVWGWTGAVGIFTGQASVWTYRVRLSNPFADDDDQLGKALDLERLPGGQYGLIAASLTASAVLYEGSGSAWAFQDIVGGWNAEAVAREDATMIVAEPFNGVPNGGRVLIYVPAGGGYALQSNLSSPAPTSINRFGRSIALDGDLLAVGETFDPFGGPGHGKLHVFKRSGATWSVVRTVTLPGASQLDNFGWRVALAGSDLVVGAPYASGTAGLSSGAVSVLRIGSASTTYCAAGTSTAGCVARMSSVGTPSASLAAPFALTASGVDGQRAGFVFYGLSGSTDLPWSGSSVLCVKTPVRRTRAHDSLGTLGGCDGSFTLDWNHFVLSEPTALGQPFGAGDEIFVQSWYRDPLAVKSTQLSDALAFILSP